MFLHNNLTLVFQFLIFTMLKIDQNSQSEKNLLGFDKGLDKYIYRIPRIYTYNKIQLKIYSHESRCIHRVRIF